MLVKKRAGFPARFLCADGRWREGSEDLQEFGIIGVLKQHGTHARLPQFAEAGEFVRRCLPADGFRHQALHFRREGHDGGVEFEFDAGVVIKAAQGHQATDGRVVIQQVAAGKAGHNGVVEAGDGSAALEIAALRNTFVMIGRSRTFDDYFAESVTNVGLKGEQAQTNLLSQNAIMADLRDLRDSISGVNIDEELADIIKFQHGYNAAAKFVSVVDELLDTVINRLGV